ncbi:hypothetical protein L0Y81_30045 (plasmid) [Burkholderia multivorans]|uniref:hypothetical protein n=1 Tax=Burkholderia multivorans TaxID=87883 RepID=UPI0011B29831|nr:hypothetical protein [Burkholderia multivorans]MBR8048905.1 hypothetical protein [Burkholderia multivorans]MBR8453311.1 hypothetical protein [Burkholderia multivorans]MBU9451302.1 hypothetical protein [Burkholderia multivorans]MCA8224692.1 hypothetical protein [Burkholderia multivorans]MCL4647398.1 hypothetical protein [Burkholderia multivorans]
MKESNLYSVTLPREWPLATSNRVRNAQIRIILNTIVTDALYAWQRAPHRTWKDISRLVLRQMATLDRLYPNAGVLAPTVQAIAVEFFVSNVDRAIVDFGRRVSDPPAAFDGSMDAHRVCRTPARTTQARRSGQQGDG